VIFHRVFPNILIDFVDDLDFDGKTKWLVGQFKIPVRALSSDWDNLKVGCGPPPIKTKDGWLLIYQAVGKHDETRYKIGAMLLDLKDPTKVLARTKKPILEPVTSYENDGLKEGVVYPCGAVVINDRLFVYYGGADMVVCVASAKLESFMAQLVTYHREIKPESIPAQSTAKIEKTDEVRETIQGFCLKCRRTREIKNPRHLMLNGRHAVQGICPKCGSKMSRLIKSRLDIDQDKLLESQIKNKKHKKA
jgi:Zn finger protein HypA/HybF involved in hydrogenase expression